MAQCRHTTVRMYWVGGKQLEKIAPISQNLNCFKGFLVYNDKEKNLLVSVEKTTVAHVWNIFCSKYVS